MKQFNNLTMKNNGLTLIEMLVAVTVFAIIVGAISGLFISGVRAQRRVLATQEILDQTSYVMEYIGRALRMAKKDLTGDCISAELNYEKTGSGDGGIRFKNYKDTCQEFYLKGTQLMEEKNGNLLPLTSDNLRVVYFNIDLSGQSQADDLQPRVTIYLEIESERQVPGSPPEIRIQTSISQRSLDIQE